MEQSKTAYRTHNCGELRLTDAGTQVTLAGFLENFREVGGSLGFAVLRDFYGTTQVVAETEEMVKAFKALNKESTLAVTGVVRERDAKNPKLPTGEIEVVPEKIEVLGRCRYNELPFPVARSREADESARLKYRYLDLRNSEVKGNIVLRSQVVSALRKAMEGEGFMEITTPILTASSPEGARDYLVPSRKHPGKFYALPQAPQQFKQLLMASGFDKYFQIAPCFRDEDARGDRSPGEFYQLDMEMAFASQEDVFAVLERVLPPIFAKYGTYNVASQAPFRRIPYLEAMDKYGSDKPDLRIDLTVQDATAVLSACGFGPFEGNTVKAVKVTGFNATRKQIDKLCADVEVQAGQKVYWFRYDESGEVVGGIAKFVSPIKEAVVEALGLEKNTFVGLTAGPLLTAQKTAGVLIKMLPALAPQHMDAERYEFCWIVDFPMYEIGEESGELEFCHNPFSMPNGGLDILKKAAAGEVDPLSITAFQYDLVCNGVEL
ncbi:MAG TPA: aspartate--tRNA ligase, partial [Candidatus Galloscillospira stercoripullorum]|nr:aspartate--tRNA ligase [Candidatus Galloscillospira stercoripullorum]